MAQPDSDLWICVTNTEKRWSIWPADLPVPAGWDTKSDAATKSECLDKIEAEWSDQRPAALRETMA